MKDLSFSIVSHEGLYTFTDTLLGILAEHDLSATGIPAFQTAVTDHFDAFDKSLKRDRKDALTEELVRADSARDDRLIGFRMYVEATAYRANPDWGPASERIMDVVRRYGVGAWRTGYAAETASIKNLVADLQQEPLASDISLIEATPWLTELQQAQEAFDTLYAQRMTQEQEDIMPIADSRKKLVASLRNLLNMIDLQHQLESAGPLASIVSSIDELTTSTMITARAEQTRQEPE
ncbi:MAG: hypothetical protein K9I47_10490 [Bacteroidales bacterium]|nr:hypothetical protein [Bacteroidales bacterium]